MVYQDEKINGKNNVCVALLEDGQMVVYDGCSNEYNIDFYKPEMGWKFIGKGAIYSVNGVRQSNDGLPIQIARHLMEETKYFFVMDKA